MNTAIAIKTDTFEGPMELLIDLVEKRKLLINDISLAAVTDEYMQNVSAMQELSLPNTAQFITLAATLLLIKSKSLLPTLDLSSEEEASIEDLEERLRRYQVYRDAAEGFKSRFNSAMMYEAEFVPTQEPLFVADNFCSTNELSGALQRVLVSLPQAVVKPTVRVRQTVSLEDMMSNLRTRIEQQLKFSFSEIRNTQSVHKDVIVGFLAILELFKQGNIIITQTGRFDDINLELDQASIPKYY